MSGQSACALAAHETALAGLRLFARRKLRRGHRGGSMHVEHAGRDVRPRSLMMKTKSKIVRWGTLAILIAAMSGCCVAPWGYGRGYGHGYGEGGYHGGYGGGYHGH
jgi:hypothetical protein